MTFSIKYLSNFAKSTPLAERVRLHMSNEVPLLVEYAFDQGHIRYYLAPKIAVSPRSPCGQVRLGQVRYRNLEALTARRPPPGRVKERIHSLIRRIRSMLCERILATLFSHPFP